MVKSRTWVGISAEILAAGARAAGIPEDTAAVPLLMWCKGWLLEDCALGAVAEIRTVTGRRERGVLEEIEPATNVDYGGYVGEISRIVVVARDVLFGGGAVE
ncbi:MAG: 2-amino-4-oxopentanoate thiolase subunit OrtA [Defluviitaleaceae bacterium]|nr:2-amino-4-oxopentanoate thiolase subunit OrtA [Defluviitaleaceae bacterium]